MEYIPSTTCIGRNLIDKTLVLASHNAGKVSELSALVSPFGCKVEGAKDLGVIAPEENGKTFAENALVKARHSTKVTGKISLSDDSGLCVTALQGRPGIYSARYAGADGNFAQAMQKLERELKGIKDLSASFVCVLAVVFPDGEELVFDGKVFGTLTFPMRGNKGFGYDPIFIPKGYTRTFAEINPEEKHAISHRAQAFAKMVRACFKTP